MRLEQPLDPGVGKRGNIFLLHHEMPGEGKPVELGLRQTRPQVGREGEVEDRIALAPGNQHRHLQLGQPVGHGSQRRVRRVGRSRRDVCDEVRDRLPVVARRIRREIRAPRLAVDAAVRRCQRRPQKSRGPPTAEVAQQLVASEADRQRHPTRRHRDSGVGEQDAQHLLVVLERPAERDRPSPVVRGHDDRSLDVERIEDPAEIVDPLRVHPRAGALREPHRDLVDGDHAVAVAEALVERAPHHRPRRVAVDADDGQRRHAAVGRRGVERVHPHSLAAGEDDGQTS